MNPFSIVTAIASLLSQLLKFKYGTWIFKISLLSITYLALDNSIGWLVSYTINKFSPGGFNFNGYVGYIFYYLDIIGLTNLILSAFLTASMTKWAINKLAS